MESCGLYRHDNDGQLIEDGEITGGLLHLEYRASTKKLWAVLDFDAPRKLTVAEKEEFLDELRFHNIWDSLRQQHDLMYLDWETDKLSMKQVKVGAPQ